MSKLQAGRPPLGARWRRSLAWVLSGIQAVSVGSHQFRTGPRAPRVSGRLSATQRLSDSAQGQSEPKQHSGRGHGVSGCRLSWAVRLCSHPRPCAWIRLSVSPRRPKTKSILLVPSFLPIRAPLPLLELRAETPVRGCCLPPSGLAEHSVHLYCRASTSAHPSPLL
jgi:hypothetical protein